jgi:YbbR domain-containing protein
MNEQDNKKEKKNFQSVMTPFLRGVGKILNAPIGRWIENDTVVLVVSAICAILLWFSVAYNSDEKITSVIRDVPVNFDMSTSSLSRLKLYPVMDNELTVDVEISGSRMVVGNISKGDLVVNAKLNNVTGPGTYDVGLDISDSMGRNYEIKGSVPDTLTVRFDHKTEKTFEVELEMEGVEIPDGYILDTEYLSPSEITVSGPETEVSSITDCRATLTFKSPISETATYEAEVELYDADGNAVTSPYITLDSDRVSVTLPVLKKKVVPVTFDYLNVPAGFDTDTLSYTIEPEEIEIAGPESSLSTVTELHVGYINMEDFTPDFPFVYNIELPSGFIAVDNTQEVLVTFENTGYETRTYNVSEIRLVNQPDDYDVTVSTKMIYNVEITGPTEALDALAATDIVAEIDMHDVDIRVGQSTVEASILTPTTDCCWSSGGKYTAVITVRSK